MLFAEKIAKVATLCTLSKESTSMVKESTLIEIYLTKTMALKITKSTADDTVLVKAANDRGLTLHP